jgi:phosphate-selective porin
MKQTVTKILCMLLLFSATLAKAQEAEPDTLRATVAKMASDLDILKKIKVTGYIQPQFQWADSMGQAGYGGGNFNSGVDKRFQLREARLKVTYDNVVTQGVFQIDVTERGVSIKDMYLRVTDPWTNWVQLKVGMFDRPFGFEIGYSSSLRETPDRARMSQIIFPGERDLGATIALQGPKGGNWNWLRLEGGMFNGTGAPGVSGSATGNTSDFDKKKDFIGRISATRTTRNEKIKYAIGASIYDGGWRADNDTAFHIATDSTGAEGFIVDDNKKQKGSFTKRQYIGGDVQISIEWVAGITTLRGEFIQGKQPGTSSSTGSPALAVTSPVYKREFNGAYFYFIHDIAGTPLELVAKYDWYDPNTDAKGDDIGKSVAGGKSFGTADLKYSTLGVGLAYHLDANVKFTAYYDMVTNETSANLKGYNNDLEDNLFTLRAQYKF